MVEAGRAGAAGGSGHYGGERHQAIEEGGPAVELRGRVELGGHVGVHPDEPPADGLAAVGAERAVSDERVGALDG